jgi:hypothetical protein
VSKGKKKREQDAPLVLTNLPAIVIEVMEGKWQRLRYLNLSDLQVNWNTHLVGVFLCSVPVSHSGVIIIKLRLYVTISEVYNCYDHSGWIYKGKGKPMTSPLI